MIKGKGILLRPISENDTDFVLSMRNNLEIANQFFTDPPVYDFAHRRWLSSLSGDIIDLIIETKERERAGRIYLTNIDYRNSKAEFGIALQTVFTGKGIASVASELLLDYCFGNLPIRKVYLQVFSDNKKAIALYEKLGFAVEGLFKQEVFKRGNFKDIIRMAVFKCQWIEQRA